jgi:hypothetical protein
MKPPAETTSSSSSTQHHRETQHHEHKPLGSVSIRKLSETQNETNRRRREQSTDEANKGPRNGNTKGGKHISRRKHRK